MTLIPTIITAEDLAARARAEADAMPATTLSTREPEGAAHIGLHPRRRVDHFHLPRLTLAGLSHSSSHPSRAGSTRQPQVPQGTFRPSVSTPAGVPQFTVRPGTDDDAQIHRLGRSLLHFRPGHGESSTGTPPATSESSPSGPSLQDVRGHISHFRGAMAVFRRAMLFGGEDRFETARAALTQAQASYDQLYAGLPMTPSMEGILRQYRGQLESAAGDLVALEPHRPSRMRR